MRKGTDLSTCLHVHQNSLVLCAMFFRTLSVATEDGEMLGTISTNDSESEVTCKICNQHYGHSTSQSTTPGFGMLLGDISQPNTMQCTSVLCSHHILVLLFELPALQEALAFLSFLSHFCMCQQ